MSFTVVFPDDTIHFCQQIETADILAETGGTNTQVFYNGPTGAWELWTEGEAYPDENDDRYHLFLLEFKRVRRRRRIPYMIIDIRDETLMTAYANLSEALHAAATLWSEIPVTVRPSVNPYHVYDAFRNTGIMAYVATP